MSPIEAIRRKCLDCSCYQRSEVALCQAMSCPLWPFRAGKHPLHEKTPAGAVFSAGVAQGYQDGRKLPVTRNQPPGGLFRPARAYLGSDEQSWLTWQARPQVRSASSPRVEGDNRCGLLAHNSRRLEGDLSPSAERIARRAAEGHHQQI